MTLPSNPYIAGDPVSGQARFIGRADVLRDVLRALRNPNTNALLLFGQRRIGKTSVLLQLESALSTAGEYTPVYFDLQDKAALPLADVLYQLAQRIASIVGVPLPPSERFDPNGDFFRDTFLPEAAQRAAGKSLVLLFDEFDVLDLPQQEQAGAAFFPYLRAWMAQAERVQFVFVLGRRPEDLSTDTLAAFKAVRSRHVSLMSRADSAAIVRQSLDNQSLHWRDDGVERVWHWTQGHPFLTQLLCSDVWETAYDEEPETTPSVGAAQVNAAIAQALEHGANQFQWIWNGLPSAERVVMAAMAEANQETIAQDELAEILTRSGVRLILRQLELAPDTLVRWDLLRPADGGFRFAVPLLRRWVAVNKPLRRVKAELDRLDPLADNLYHSGEGMYNLGDLAEAERLLRRALDVNPNHFNARVMLGRVLLGQGNPAGAVEVLELAYEFDRSARSGLIAALLALAETQDEEEQLMTFDRVLTIEAEQPVALEKKRAVWLQRANAALEQDDLEVALRAYQQIDDQDRGTHVQTLQHKRKLAGQLEDAKKYEAAKDWLSAVAIYEQLLAEFPDYGDWQQWLEVARTQATLVDAYNQALNALQKENSELTQHLLGKVIGIDPTYKESARYLLLATTGTDVKILMQQHREASAKVKELEHQLNTEITQHHQAEQKATQFKKKAEQRVAQLKEKLDTVQKVLENPLAKRRQLALWSPEDYLRLLWWVLIQSKELEAYKANLDDDGEAHLKRQGSWLVSTLTWWPLLAWVAWSLLDSSLELEPMQGYGCLAAVILVWLLTGGLFGTSYDSIGFIAMFGIACYIAITFGIGSIMSDAGACAASFAALVMPGLLFLTAFAIVGEFMFYVDIDDIAGDIASVVGFVTALIVVSIVTINMASSVAFGVASIVASFVALGVASIVASFVALGVASSIVSDVASSIVSGVAVGVAGVMASLVAVGVTEDIVANSGAGVMAGVVAGPMASLVAGLVATRIKARYKDA